MQVTGITQLQVDNGTACTARTDAQITGIVVSLNVSFQLATGSVYASCSATSQDDISQVCTE